MKMVQLRGIRRPINLTSGSWRLSHCIRKVRMEATSIFVEAKLRFMDVLWAFHSLSWEFLSPAMARIPFFL